MNKSRMFHGPPMSDPIDNGISRAEPTGCIRLGDPIDNVITSDPCEP